MSPAAPWGYEPQSSPPILGWAGEPQKQKLVVRGLLLGVSLGSGCNKGKK